MTKKNRRGVNPRQNTDTGDSFWDPELTFSLPAKEEKKMPVWQLIFLGCIILALTLLIN